MRELGQTKTTKSTLMLTWLLVGVLFLVALDTLLNFGFPQGSVIIRKMFNIAGEDSFGTWYAAALYGVIAFKLFERALHSRQPIKLLLSFFSSFFVWMSIDEVVQVHERVGSMLPAQDVLHSYPWLLYLAPLFVICGATLFFFFWLQSSSFNRLLLIVMASCIFAALLLDCIEGLPISHPDNLWSRMAVNAEWCAAKSQSLFAQSCFQSLLHYGRVLEESLEMATSCLFIFFLTRYDS